MSEVSIKLYNETTVVTVEDNEVILEAAIRAKLDPPFSCRSGNCCTCRAKLISGTVRMDVNDALSDDEVSEGYILTCQSHPTSEFVVIDYDQ